MRRANNKPSHGDRTRYLNIVYFVESARSHTVRINLTYARWLVAMLVVVGFWALGSVFWISQLRVDNAKTRDRLEQALTTIFDYQIKTEKVFEEAYPPEISNTYYSELAQLPSNNPVSPSVQDQLASTKRAPSIDPQTPTEKPQPKPAAEIAQPNTLATNSLKKSAAASSTGVVTSANMIKTEQTENTPSSVATTSTPLLEISSAKLSKNNGHIFLNFNMRNKIAQRAEGFIWAVAVISNENGTTKPLVAPAHTRIDLTSGAIIAAKTAYRFSILKFKNKEFDFKPTEKSNWKLTKLTIHYTNIEGSNEQKMDIPVEQIAVTNVADTPATDISL